MSKMFKIFAGNVNFQTTEEKLREVFEPHIEIEDVVIARDPRTGRSRGFGFVMTRDAEKGRRAIQKVGKVEIDNRKVYFKEATGKPSKRKKAQRGRQGRRGGQTRTAKPRPPRPRIATRSFGYRSADEERQSGSSGYAGTSGQQPPSPDQREGGEESNR